MGRPRLIVIIRHAQSEGNKNREIHQTIPDHRVKLTADGWSQAHEAGRRLRSMLRADDTLHFFTSPYRRTRETTEGILSTLTSDDPDPTPFKRSSIKVYEEPRLREQDFGNFQPCSAEMERMWQERADYGHFFYRIPNGESAADAYDRVSGFNESLWRQFGEDDCASVCVLVTHGLMSRVFLMKWYHFSVEYFEDLRNINHCELLIMKAQEGSGKYILQNKLRTWSELRKERAALKPKEEAEKKEDTAVSSTPTVTIPKLDRQHTIGGSPVVQRRWGGCPEGCNHAKHFKIRRDLAELRSVDEKHAAKSSGLAALHQNQNSSTKSSGLAHQNQNSNSTSAQTLAARRIRHANSSDDDSDDPRGLPPNARAHHHHHVNGGSGDDGPKIDVTKAREEVVSSPDGTPSYITLDDRLRGHKSPHFLHVGRDGGGSHSGANSDAELSEDDARQRLASIAARVKPQHQHQPSALNGGTAANGNGVTAESGGASEKQLPHRNGAGGSRAALANKLGDAPLSRSEHGSEDGGDEREEGCCEHDHDHDHEEDLDAAEKEDKSLAGSVY